MPLSTRARREVRRSRCDGRVRLRAALATLSGKHREKRRAIMSWHHFYSTRSAVVRLIPPSSNPDPIAPRANDKPTKRLHSAALSRVRVTPCAMPVVRSVSPPDPSALFAWLLLLSELH